MRSFCDTAVIRCNQKGCFWEDAIGEVGCVFLSVSHGQTCTLEKETHNGDMAKFIFMLLVLNKKKMVSFFPALLLFFLLFIWQSMCLSLDLFIL